MSVFKDFTKLYSLSKTLRFELKPVGGTEKMLNDAKVFQMDETIKKKYESTKPYFDRLHREFVKEALENISINGLNEYLPILQEWQKDKKNKDNAKKLKEIEKQLRKQVVSFFNKKASEWGKNFKKSDVTMLFEEEVFKLLKVKYGDEKDAEILDESTGEMVSIFDSWKGFTGYFTKFQETRRNFYKEDGTSTALATRIVDQNLKRFCYNLQVFEKVKDKVNFSEVEESFGKSMNEVFSLGFYNKCLLQDGIDLYNSILGGDSEDQNKKGLNQYINLYKQQTKEKLSFFKTLDKQILSEKEKFIDEIEDVEQLLALLKTFHVTAQEKTKNIRNLFKDFVNGSEKYNLKEIYISKESFNTISYKWTNETKVFEKQLYDAMKPDKLSGLKYDKKEDSYKFPDFVALSYVQTALENVSEKDAFWKARYYEVLEIDKRSLWDQFLMIFDYEFSSLFKKDVTDNETGVIKIIGYDIFEKEFKQLLDNFEVTKESKIVIKDFADSVLNIYQMAKYFALEQKRKWNDDLDVDTSFYDHTEHGFKNCFYEDAYEDIVQVYNKLRNYLTRKPYSEEKWKLNFENPTLAYGWDKNKESDNSTVLLRKDGKYYLGLMKKGNTKIFDQRNKENFSVGIEKGKYEKVVYKFFPDQAKMFPKVCFSKKGLEFFQPAEEILDIYKNSEFKKGDTFSVRSMQRFIDFYKDCLIKYDGWKCYNFKHVKPTKEYRDNIGEFFRDVAEDGYKISFQDISENYINEKNQNGELYLFQIKNKDWNEGSTGAKNLHTLYFESLFSNENKDQNFPIKLNGQAEIFYRPKTSEDKLGYRENKDGSVKMFIDKRDGNKKKKVIKNRRYVENKIFFHVPLTLNRTKGDAFRFNTQINNFLANNSDINIIGVDRGEKHLAYYSVINQRGETLESDTLNVIEGGNKQKIDYHEKLEEKSKNREQARRDWQDVQGIKDLKKGYISQVVRKLADLAIKYNAIIVFEDLNMRFKQIRGGIEKSVYQQLEKALIEKLNFLVNKGEIDMKKAGHLLQAYQLSAPFTKFKDMGKQTGIIFYTQAAYTSKIDPVTGWRPNLYLKSGSAKANKENILKFSSINFVNNRFEFTYDIKEFRDQKEWPNNTVWTVCSNVERFRWNRKENNNKGGYKHYRLLTKQFSELFDSVGIDYQNSNILEQIKSLSEGENVQFFKDFIYYWQLLCQIRNTNSDEKGNDNDFILSPVKPFFDSRKDNGKNLPENGDDNGAYNIARKGRLILNKISDFANNNENCEKLKWGDLYISNTDWDNYIQLK